MRPAVLSRLPKNFGSRVMALPFSTPKSHLTFIHPQYRVVRAYSSQIKPEPEVESELEWEDKPAWTPPISVNVCGQDYPIDRTWYNVPSNVIKNTTRKLHLQLDHPLYITRQVLQSNFPEPTFRYYNDLSPAVTTHQNFDSLGFPTDHPGRARSDTYYINGTTVLRTHTSAHQADTFRKDESDGYLISADVYRRDAIDRSHYPVFHQMEGARSWDRAKVPNGDIVAAVQQDIEKLKKHSVEVEDLNPTFHPERNPLQEAHHSPEEANAIGTHLKRSLEAMVVDIFSRAKAAALKANPNALDEPLRMRWVEAYFPFTSPSWELEVFYEGNWLEVLGCGVVKQDLYINAGVPQRLGWAFGIGIDRIAMLLFKMTDIRLFWSQDQRFLKQFTGVSDNLDLIKPFVSFSKYPPAPRDVSFWLGSNTGKVFRNTAEETHENDVMEVVRNVAGDLVEDVSRYDEFTHPKTGRKSNTYKIIYRSLERTMTSDEIHKLHTRVCNELVRQLGVEIR